MVSSLTMLVGRPGKEHRVGAEKISRHFSASYLFEDQSTSISLTLLTLLTIVLESDSVHTHPLGIASHPVILLLLLLISESPFHYIKSLSLS